MDRWLREIAALDPVADARRVYRLSAGFEFPWDYRRSLELALFRTYCVPSISALLDRTGVFAERPQQRYDDTALLMGELAEHGCDSTRGRAALRIINRLHGRHPIANDDMLYVLSTFVYEPIDWIDAYGWRRLHEHERVAAYHHYREVGRRMGITGIPDDAGLRAFKTAYEREHFAFSETNRRIGTYTLELFASWWPAPLRPAARLGVRALLDEPMLAAFGFRPAPRPVPPAVRAALRARSAVVRVLPPRRRSKLTREPRNRTYPGYPDRWDVTDLGAR
ncbi:MAG TPA: oxygenase MpaB family protein [Mycobacteriales bacterium]|nr:oxygenase MpaB family protein [Mycobacteriales bacterium]